jgi:hypothetical protein
MTVVKLAVEEGWAPGDALVAIGPTDGGRETMRARRRCLLSAQSLRRRAMKAVAHRAGSTSARVSGSGITVRCTSVFSSMKIDSEYVPVASGLVTAA